MGMQFQPYVKMNNQLA